MEMSNEEGTRGIVTEVASPDPLPPKSDGGDTSPPLSRYSSCGESDFERYCSANSVMGTPSVRSSFGGVFNDSLESEFGFGDDIGFENFSLGGSCKVPVGDRKLDFCEGKADGDAGLEGSMENGRGDKCLFEVNGNDLSIPGSGSRRLVGDSVGNASGLKQEVEKCSLTRDHNHIEGDCLDGMDSRSCVGFEVDEDYSSSRYEHSEGDDSMYNYGSDDEVKVNSYYPRNAEHVPEKRENENPLVINSHVAFGSEDWDDFEQEVGGVDQSSLSLEKLQYKSGLKLESEDGATSFTSLNPIRLPSDSETRKGATDSPVHNNEVQGAYDAKENSNESIVTITEFPCSSEWKHVEEVRDIPVASYQGQSANVVVEEIKTLFPTSIGLPNSSESKQVVRDSPSASYQVQSAEKANMHFYDSSINDAFEMHHNPIVEKDLFKIGREISDTQTEKIHGLEKTKEVVNNDSYEENQEFDYVKARLDSLDISSDQHCSNPAVPSKELNPHFHGNDGTKLSPLILGNNVLALEGSSASANLFENHLGSNKIENLEHNDFYDEIVHEMEEILLDYSESPGALFSPSNQTFRSQSLLPQRDGGATASTSGTDDSYPITQHLLRIDGVEVVGAKQKKGDVSLSERLVGVKEYTVYRIRVWSGKDQWEVERRYRDFFTLYRRLKSFFTGHGWILPSPWSAVEKESRKIFRNSSPDVVAERSVLIQECLESILCSNYYSSPPSALIWFLSPQESLPSSPASNMLVSQSRSLTERADNFSTLGKTISLIVELPPYKSKKQILEAQHYTCVGCHKHFDDGMTLMQDLVQTFGWGKPRLCEYTGQLFCSSCHTNETAVLPARVLHHWDFTQYPVSQLAKSYLDSVHDQPMLCVSAVNPFLFSKVPALQHVMNLRKRIGSMLPYVRCPFRASVNKGLGSRRYLLEGNDFFALRDLIDLSKGPFAALPVMVETVSRRILEHITEQCLICCDVGVPCCARQACNDPSALIFGFQEGEVEKCKFCEAVFHKPCFKKITNCPCGVPLGGGEAGNSTKNVSNSSDANKSLTIMGNRSGSGLSVGLLSGLFSKAKPEKDEHKSDIVILMGALPSTSL